MWAAAAHNAASWPGHGEAHCCRPHRSRAGCLAVLYPLCLLSAAMFINAHGSDWVVKGVEVRTPLACTGSRRPRTVRGRLVPSPHGDGSWRGAARVRPTIARLAQINQPSRHPTPTQQTIPAWQGWDRLRSAVEALLRASAQGSQRRLLGPDSADQESVQEQHAAAAEICICYSTSIVCFMDRGVRADVAWACSRSRGSAAAPILNAVRELKSRVHRIIVSGLDEPRPRKVSWCCAVGAGCAGRRSFPLGPA